MKKIVFISLIVISLFSACHNQDWEFDDYDYTTVYFAYQTPVRTIVLGDDIYDNSLDNAHKCKIMATMGGVYSNEIDRILDLSVDNSLCDNLKFKDTGKDVVPMPSNYYSLENDMQIVIPKGSRVGGIEVQLTDAFFEDLASLSNTYVIPLRIANVINADSILSGEPAVDNPNPVNAEDWGLLPKNYILYCVKYINPWQAKYLRRGQDVVMATNGDNSLNTTNVYHADYIEGDEVVSMNSVAFNEVSLALNTRNGGSDENIPFELRLSFTDEGSCTITAPAGAAYTLSGSGKYVKDAEEWGDKERDVVYLDYNIDFGTTTHSFKDTLVMRDRGIVLEEFEPEVVQ